MKNPNLLREAITVAMTAFLISFDALASPNELIPPKVIEGLRSAKYSVDEIKKTEMGATAMIQVDRVAIEITWQRLSSVDEAHQKALGAAARVSAGLQFLSMDKNHTALLHRQFLYAHKGATFFRLESKSGRQEENLKKVYEAIIASLQ